jgi:hypothetical protein
MSPETICTFVFECLQLAQKTKDPQHRALLLDIVSSCRDLSNALDRFQVFADQFEDKLIESPPLAMPESVGAAFKSGNIIFMRQWMATA